MSHWNFRCSYLTGMLALLGVCATGLRAQAPQTGIIDGSVVDRITGNAVPDALISVEGTSLTTTANAFGRFELSGLSTGEAIVLIEARSFLPLRVPGVQVSAGATTQLEVDLVRTPNLFQQIQVTATKDDVSIGDLAVPATILDRESIDRRGDVELTSAIERVI